MRSKEEIRTNLSTIIEQLDQKPNLIKLVFWIILMPIRVMISTARKTGQRGFGALIGIRGVTYCAILLAPIIAPFTYYKRWQNYRTLTKSAQTLLEKAKLIDLRHMSWTSYLRWSCHFSFNSAFCRFSRGTQRYQNLQNFRSAIHDVREVYPFSLNKLAFEASKSFLFKKA